MRNSTSIFMANGLPVSDVNGYIGIIGSPFLASAQYIAVEVGDQVIKVLHRPGEADLACEVIATFEGGKGHTNIVCHEKVSSLEWGATVWIILAWG